VTKEEYRLVSDSQWRYLHMKLNRLSKIVDNLRSSINDMNNPKKFLRFSEVLPPERVCRDITSMVIGTKSYDGFLGRLSEHYGVPLLEFSVDENIPDGINDQYRVNEWHPDGRAYCKNKTVGRRTVLHEFFHHLVHHRVAIVEKEREEEYADRYARSFLQRAGRSN